MNYNLELEELKVKVKGKKVLIQLPDGLKPYAKEIADAFVDAKDVFIWGGSCFGACDIPNVNGFDLIVQFGHSRLR